MKNSSISICLMAIVFLINPVTVLTKECHFSGEALQGIDDIQYYINEDVKEYNSLCATEVSGQSTEEVIRSTNYRIKELVKLQGSMQKNHEFGNKIKRQWDSIRYSCEVYGSDENESRARYNRKFVKSAIKKIKILQKQISECKVSYKSFVAS